MTRLATFLAGITAAALLVVGVSTSGTPTHVIPGTSGPAQVLLAEDGNPDGPDVGAAGGMTCCFY